MQIAQSSTGLQMSIESVYKLGASLTLSMISTTICLSVATYSVITTHDVETKYMIPS